MIFDEDNQERGVRMRTLNEMNYAINRIKVATLTFILTSRAPVSPSFVRCCINLCLHVVQFVKIYKKTIGRDECE